ncbi:hypothetical protein R3P08_13600 [Pseudoalteromonas sp. UG3-1]|uniref:hypothetical protein n=1 Tax=Pseudoalteromonas sp. UG3-1 TaxID=3080053 RepID=UPI003014613D
MKKSSPDIDYIKNEQASTYLSDSKVLNDKYLNIVVGASGGSKGGGPEPQSSSSDESTSN